jgi:hypothetical protein
MNYVWVRIAAYMIIASTCSFVLTTYINKNILNFGVSSLALLLVHEWPTVKYSFAIPFFGMNVNPFDETVMVRSAVSLHHI